MIAIRPRRRVQFSESANTQDLPSAPSTEVLSCPSVRTRISQSHQQSNQSHHPRSERRLDYASIGWPCWDFSLSLPPHLSRADGRDHVVFRAAAALVAGD